LAVSSAVWVSFVGPRRSGLADQCTLSASFAFLQSLAQLDLADQPQPVSSSLGLSFPTAHQGSEVHLPRGLPRHPLRSARRVWLPSRRLTPSEPVPALFRAGSAPGIRPAELSPLGRYPPRFRGDGPTRRFSRRYSRRRSAWAGPTGRGLWVLTLPGVPRDRHRVSAATAGCSLGLRPLRVYRLGLGTDLRPRSSLALSETQPHGQDPRRPGVSISPNLAPSDTGEPAAGRATLAGFSHRIIPERSSEAPHRAIGFTSRRVVHYWRPPALLGR
jgi:hypothetical protein